MPIYHERQEALQCGRHCLNNLLQRHVFARDDLDALGLAMDAEEQMIWPCAETGANYGAEGNYSVQVLEAALAQAGIRMENIAHPQYAAARDKPEEQVHIDGYLVHRTSAKRNSPGHWFALRRFGSVWRNLDSTLPAPQIAGPLSTIFRRPRTTVYAVLGVLPPIAGPGNESGEGPEEDEPAGGNTPRPDKRRNVSDCMKTKRPQEPRKPKITDYQCPAPADEAPASRKRRLDRERQRFKRALAA